MQLLAYAYQRNARPQKAAALLAALDALAPGQRRVLRALAHARCAATTAPRCRRWSAWRSPGASTWPTTCCARALAASGRRIEASAAMAACQVIRAALVPPEVTA